MERKVFANWICSRDYLTDREKNALFSKCQSFDAFCALDMEQSLSDFRETKRSFLSEERLHFIRDHALKEKWQEDCNRLTEQGIFFTCAGEAGFPKTLTLIPDPPLGLYYKGKLPGQEKQVAIIGARDCSAYGEKIAKELGKKLGERGVPVVSGMARGIDGMAQQAALQAGGTSFGVLGCGVDICYPRSNQQVYQLLLSKGGVLSTFYPGTKPLPMFFPQRNRIVSGLSDLVIVVEAGAKSGTLITVDMALEQGKEVWAVPGRIEDRLSYGCNRLIAQGAGNLWDMEEFLETIAPAKRMEKKEVISLEKQLMAVLKVLDDTPKSTQEIEEQLQASDKVDITEVNVMLMRLVLDGYARQPYSGYFCRQ